MKKITDFIINKRYFILVTFIIVTIICGFLATKVKINDDITAYLPSDSETRIGMDIMEREFSSQNNSSSLNIMFKNFIKYLRMYNPQHYIIMTLKLSSSFIMLTL